MFTTPSLSTLKDRWFIPVGDGDLNAIPCRRATGSESSLLSAFTDGNTVRPVIDGEDYMRTWRDDLLALQGQRDANFFHSGWRLEGMKPLGMTAPPGDALDDMVAARQNGVETYVLACRNLSCLRFNQVSIRRLRNRGIRAASLDPRFPPGGSNHQKFSVMRSVDAASALVGSVDIAKTRWDTSEHLAVNPDRHLKHGMQTHETAVRIEGPAVADLAGTFCERWNDPTRTRGVLAARAGRPSHMSTPGSLPSRGTHSVQVLRTYGIAGSTLGYSWSPVGEFTVWASHVNALKSSSSYIYIEDQYFLPFDWPPCFARSGVARETDLVYQLGEAMKRGVNVVVVTTSADNPSPWGPHQKHHRDIAVNYLHSVRVAGSRGDLVVASLQSEGSDIYVHSKLLIVDDEFVSVGSANIAQRSMGIDSELQVGIVDEANQFARDFRTRLWGEHIGAPPSNLDDPNIAFATFKTAVAARRGHLKPYSVDPLSVFPANGASNPPPRGHAAIIRWGVDPYAGPRGLR